MGQFSMEKPALKGQQHTGAKTGADVDDHVLASAVALTGASFDRLRMRVMWWR